MSYILRLCAGIVILIKMQASCRAGVHTFAASDAFGGTGYFIDGKRYRTGLFASPAGNTPFLFPMNLHKAEPVEQAVYCAQRTQILAERPVNLYGKNQQKDQDSQFPEKQSPCLAAQHFIGGKKGNCAKQRSRGAQIFAECRNLGEASEQKQGANAYQQEQNRIFPIFQDRVEGQTFSFMKHRYLMQKILYQPERAKPAADKAPQETSKQEEKSQCRKGNLKTLPVQQSLKRPDGTGGYRPGTGVTI